MGRSDEIAELIGNAGGVASAAQLSKAGFLPGSVSHALKTGAIDRLTRGVNRIGPDFIDAFYAAFGRLSSPIGQAAQVAAQPANPKVFN